MSDEFVTLLASLITALATLGSVWLGRKYMAKKDKNCIIKETLQNTNVYTALSFLVGEMGADRAYIMEFHNGEHYFSGRGQQKFSCTYEAVEQGISVECENSQNHRVSNYHVYIKELIDNGCFVYTDLARVEDRSFLKMIQDKGVSAIYNVPIKTLNGKIIGILGIDYVKSTPPDDLMTDCKFRFMRAQARILGGYLV